MKTTFKVMLMVLVAAFYSCQKSEKDETPASSVSTDGVLSGTIVNYASATLDSVKVYDNSSYIGRSSVTTDGKFSMSLSIPKLYKTGTIEGVTISDTTALVGNAIFYCYKAGIGTGELGKLNFNSKIDSIKSGMASCLFIYANKPFTMKGTRTDSFSSGVYSENATYIYDITFKKGWNEIVIKIDAYSSTSSTSFTEKMIYSNTITSDLQWRYFPNSSSNVRSNAKGLSGLKSGKLF